MFLKPHAYSKQVDSFLRTKLAEQGISIKQAGLIDNRKIDENQMIDTHYGAIASKAMTIKPKDLEVSSKAKGDFEKAFGLTWDDAVKQGKVFNAKDACELLQISGTDLDELWSKTKRGTTLIKFGGGFYCAKIGEIFIINGFYAAMREKYVADGAQVAWYEVTWPSGDVSWEDFRAKVVGATDPNDAAPGSLRRSIFLKWREMNLPAEPDVGDNGIHASASALEALAEIVNWGQKKLSDDDFGVALLALGYSEDEIAKMLSDTKTKTKGGVELAPFDDTEDKDSKQVLELLKGEKVEPAEVVRKSRSNSVF